MYSVASVSQDGNLQMDSVHGHHHYGRLDVKLQTWLAKLELNWGQRGKSVGDKMHKGANAWDLLKFFIEVQKRNLEQGRKIQFKLRKQAGVIDNIA